MSWVCKKGVISAKTGKRWVFLLLVIVNNGSGDKSKHILGQKQAFNFRTILDPTLLKK